MARFDENFSLDSVSWDVAVVAFCAVALFILGISGGRRAAIPFLVSLYIGRTLALFFSQAAPGLARDGFVVLPWYAPAAVFVLAVLGATWLLAGSSVFSFLRLSARGLSVWWQVLLASGVGAGAFVSMLYPMLASRLFFSAIVESAFIKPPLPFLWALAPLVLLFFIRATEE